MVASFSSMNNKDDAPSLGRAERAEEFALLLGRHARQIYAYITTLVPHWADAEDIFQETISIIWQKFGEFAPGSNFRAWSYQVAYYRVMAFREQQKQQKKNMVSVGMFSEEFSRLVTQETLAQQNLLEDQHQALADCVKELPEEDRELIERCYTPRTTIKQVAQEMGRSPEATYKTLKRIHQQLFDCVESHLEDEEP
jgi:RNA polymerase sigma-70 factor, ECF subfamily